MNTPLRIICHFPVCRFISKTGKKIQRLSQWLFHPICSVVSRLNLLLSFSTSRQQHSAHYYLDQTRERQLNCTRAGSHSWSSPLAFHTFPSVVMGWSVFHSVKCSLYVHWSHVTSLSLHCSIYSIPMSFSVGGTSFLCYASQWKNIVWLSSR